ncbi:MAG: Swt1 family HEPN domain-containing protein [Meiothermus ruber]|uniref:Swt1 family HEPN domain-containing protein n=1 Tax=Meiothermus ruber TaxID=277 RepID=UPI00391C38DA
MSERDFANPFSDYGIIVFGERFINRRNSVRAVENRVIRPREPGNLAITGDYRIGKSSLAYHSIMERKSALLKEGRIPIWINLATFDKASMFFRSLVTSSYDELDGLGWLSDEIKTAAGRALLDEVTWSEGYGRIQRYFEKIRQAGLRILFILDEFDHARHLFKGDISGFQSLRELSYRPEWRVTFVTTSRRSLQSIELQTKAISTLDHTFHKHYLSMFEEDALEEYFERLSSVGIAVNPQIKERFLFYCGGHPYLLEMLGYETVEMFRETDAVDVDLAVKCIEQSIIDHYEHMLNVLAEDQSLKMVLQILFGPTVDAKITDAEEFQRYGLIRSDNEGRYFAFSEHFQTYLKMIERQVDLWPLWKKTEVALRQIVTQKMMEHYGEQWVERLSKVRPNLKLIFERSRESQQKEEKSFGHRASRNIIDFTYPKDLFDIIFAEWSIFRDIFGKDKNYWDQRAQLLSKMRTPLAHNRDQALHDYERRTAEGYCEEVLTILDEYDANRSL